MLKLDLKACLKNSFDRLKQNIDFMDLTKAQLLNEFISSLVVYLVALPLCLGVAIASGVPPIYGLITGVIAGMITGFFSGCPLQISGPAGGLIVIVIEIVSKFGFEKFGVIVFLAGLVQILIAVLGIGQWFQIVSPAIIRGMLGGIGVIIFASQFHVMLDSSPKASTLENILSLPALVVDTISPSAESTYHLAAGIGLITLLAIVFWKILPYKSIKVIPATLVAVILASLVANLLALPIDYVTIPDDAFAGMRFPSFASIFEVLLDFDAIFSVVALAFIATVEAILTTKVIDSLHTDKPTDHNKEVFAQGLGNALAGFLNSLPLTGVIVRSMVAMETNARTRLVAILHGLWILLTMFVFIEIISLIPLSTLAAILVLISVNLMKIEEFQKIYYMGKSEFVICIVTLVLVVLTNIFEGVLVGIVLSGLHLLRKLSRFKSNLTHLKDNYLELKLGGSLNFVNLPKLSSLLDEIPSENTVIVNLEALNFIDHSCFEAIESWQKRYTENSGVIILERDTLQRRLSS